METRITYETAKLAKAHGFKTHIAYFEAVNNKNENDEKH